MARNVPSGTTAATAEKATAPTPASKPATATLPKPTTAAPRPAAAAPARPASTAPKPAAPPKAAPSKPAVQSPGAPLTTAYAQSYPEGMSATDYSYEDLGQSDATDIAPFEQFPTSRPAPGEGTSFYRERMTQLQSGPVKYPGAAPGMPAPYGYTAEMPVRAQYGFPARTVTASGEFYTPYKKSETQLPGEFQSVAQFRDYAQSIGARLADAERAEMVAGQRLQAAASRDDTTREDLKRLYDERIARLSAVAGLRGRLKQIGFSDADIATVVEHGVLRGED